MNSFRFSPIKAEDELIQAVTYIANRSESLAQKVIGRKLPITSLTVFSHFEEEFKELKKIIAGLGTSYNENNGPRVKLYSPIIASGNKIEYLRIRKPDSERPQVGCNDYDITSYKEFKSQYLSYHYKNLRLIIRSEYEMIEFFDCEFDVLAYVVSDHD